MPRRTTWLPHPRRLLVVGAVTVAAFSAQPPSARFGGGASKPGVGGGGAGEPLSKESSAEEREREWAARIIEQHERRKKEVEVQSVVTRVAKKIVPRDAAAWGDQAGLLGSIDAGRRPTTRRAAADPGAVDPARLALVASIFDGALGRMRLSLRSSSEAMLSATAASFPLAPESLR